MDRCSPRSRVVPRKRQAGVTYLAVANNQAGEVPEQGPTAIAGMWVFLESLRYQMLRMGVCSAQRGLVKSGHDVSHDVQMGLIHGGMNTAAGSRSVVTSLPASDRPFCASRPPGARPD